jgi:putative ABC transport system permease protein
MRGRRSTRILAQRITAETGLKALTWRDFTWATIGYYLGRTSIPVNFGITVALGFIVRRRGGRQDLYIFVLENLRASSASSRPWVWPTATSSPWSCCRPWSSLASAMRSASGCAPGFRDHLTRLDQSPRLRAAVGVGSREACIVLVIIVIASFASLCKVRLITMTDPTIAVRCSGVTKSFPAGDGMVLVYDAVNDWIDLLGPCDCRFRPS